MESYCRNKEGCIVSRGLAELSALLLLRDENQAQFNEIPEVKAKRHEAVRGSNTLKWHKLGPEERSGVILARGTGTNNTVDNKESVVLRMYMPFAVCRVAQLSHQEWSLWSP